MGKMLNKAHAHHYHHITMDADGNPRPLETHDGIEMSEMVNSPAYDYATLDPTAVWCGARACNDDMCSLNQPPSVRNECPYWRPSCEEKELMAELAKLELKIIKDEELE